MAGAATRRAAVLAAAATLLLLAGPAASQETTEPAAAEEQPAAQPAPLEEEEEEELGRDTPRGAVAGYLDACRERDYEEAATYLDLRRVQEADPATLARRLRVVLSRTLWIDVEGLSADPEGRLDDDLPHYREHIGKIDSRRGSIDVLLQRVPGEDGTPVWKFAATTVARIPQLWNEYGYGVIERFLPPFFFEVQLIEIALWQWLGLLALVVATAIASWLVTVALIMVLRPIARRTETMMDDALLEGAAGPVRLAVAVPIFRAAVVPLGLGLGAMAFISSLASALFVVAVTFLLFRVVDVLASRVERRLRERGQETAISAVPPGRKAVKAALFGLGVVGVLDNFGFNVTAILAGLGVGGIAVALAAQKPVENLFGGVTLYADRPVRVGDFCRFGDKVGTVEEIGIRSTRIRTLDRTLVTVPNAEFSNLQLENFAARDSIRLYAVIGVRYETTPDQLRYILVEVRKLLYAHERVTMDPARIRFVGFGAYSLDLEIFAYVNTQDWNEYLGIREDLYLRIMDIIEASGSSFAFPSQTLYLGQDDAPTAERADEIASEVAAWRERRELFLPSFPPDRIAELEKTVAFPDEGSPDRRGEDSS